MSDKNVGSIVIADGEGRPLGIVTDTDLRRKVVGRGAPLSQRIDAIMSAPVFTVPPSLSAADAVVRMIRANVRHLCVTEDGTPDSRLVGIVSEHDILLFHGNNPAVLVKEIQSEADIERLARIRDRAEHLVHDYLVQGVSMRFITEVLSGIDDALTARILAIFGDRLGAAGMAAPPLRWCWLAFGSEGRNEQLLRTDQDNALVYEDPAPSEAPSAHDYFVRLGKEVNEALHRCGFSFCPGGNMAGNPQWCQPLRAWKEYFSGWIHVPREEALLNAAIFFDFRPAAGDESLAHELSAHIQHELLSDRTSIILLAKNALRNPPPMSVWGNFIVERGGEHKDAFDIKLRGIKPLTDAARVLALDMNIQTVTGTMQRLRQLAINDASIALLVPEVTAAYELLLRLRALQGFAHGDTGRYIDPSLLSTMERGMLRDALRATKKVQTLLRVRFQLDALGLS